MNRISIYKLVSLIWTVDSVREFFSSFDKKQVFCSNCGSSLYSQRTDMPETIRLRLGTVTSGDIPETSYVIYCESKSSWFSHKAERPRYARNTDSTMRNDTLV